MLQCNNYLAVAAIQAMVLDRLLNFSSQTRIACRMGMSARSPVISAAVSAHKFRLMPTKTAPPAARTALFSCHPGESRDPESQAEQGSLGPGFCRDDKSGGFIHSLRIRPVIPPG
jgi:hypothetical protein